MYTWFIIDSINDTSIIRWLFVVINNKENGVNEWVITTMNDDMIKQLK